MRKVFFTALLSIILCSGAAALITGSVLFFMGFHIYEQEAKERLIGLVNTKAREVNLLLADAESVVDTLAGEVSQMFTYQEFPQSSPEYLLQKEILDRTILVVLEENEHLAGLFFSFNPRLYNGREEIWYIWEDGQVEKLDVAEEAGSWFLEGNPSVDYYYKAIANDSYWTGYTWEPDLKNNTGAYTATYGRAVYDRDGMLLGVAGADIYVDDLMDILKGISLKGSGIVALYDSNVQYVAGNIENASLPFHPENLQKEIQISQEGAAAFGYTDAEGKEYLGAYSFFDNGWLPLILQPRSVVLEPFFNLKNIFIITLVFTATAIIIYIIIFSVTSVRTALKADEAKTIMLISQSRQAKVGEMVGNISHQFKQPLNLMNITLSNMKYLLHDVEGQEKGDSAEELFSEVEKLQTCIRTLSETIDDFAGFLRPDRSPVLFSLKKEILKAAGFMEDIIRIHCISLVIDLADELTMTGFRNEFCQCMINLLNNACDSIRTLPLDERKIRITGWNEDKGNILHLTIINGGGPLPDSVLQQIATPYFTTKAEMGGTGLGVYLTKQMLEHHFHGTITYKNHGSDIVCHLTFLLPSSADERKNG